MQESFWHKFGQNPLSGYWDIVIFMFSAIFVSPAKQKRDICTAFPVSSLSSSSSAKTFLYLGHFLGNYKG